MLTSDRAKARLFARIEKLLITLESMLVGVFFGIWTTVCVNPKYGIGVALLVFIFLVKYKRYIIAKERK